MAEATAGGKVSSQTQSVTLKPIASLDESAEDEAEGQPPADSDAEMQPTRVGPPPSPSFDALAI